RYLGDSIDIHGGGQDLVFPHHENEIAQSEAFSGAEPFARFWVHNGLLHLDAEKMSKSLGNLVTIRDALAKYSSDAIRVSVLNAHYRGPGYYSDEALAGAERAAARLRQAVSVRAPAGVSGERLDPSAHRERFIAAMDDDLNTPQALAVLFDLARDMNRDAEAGRDVADARSTLLELGREVLGLRIEEREAAVDDELAARVQTLVDRRTELRAAKRFAEADAARDELSALGVTLTDSTEGTTWALGSPS
ncbi:MAG: class I tRNA ligase family protein, partial [Chloroflexi bacterium]|nr:class I tRNA ligase family protein [Chloroflexota bacterium]